MNSWESPLITKFKTKYPNEDWNLLHDFLYAHPKFKPVKIKFLRQQAFAWIKQQYPPTAGVTQDVYVFSNGFKIVKLIDPDSKNWEAFHMRSCVGDLKENDNLFSLRDLQNKPHCTLEIESIPNQFNQNVKELKQVKGAVNSVVSPKYTHYILEFLAAQSIMFFELNNLGYQELTSPELSALESHANKPAIRYFNSKPYLHIFTPIKFKTTYKDYSEKFLNFCLVSKNISGIKQLLNNFKNNKHPTDHFCIFAALICNDLELAHTFISSDDSFSYWRSQVRAYIELGYNTNLPWLIDTLLNTFFANHEDYQFSLLSLLLDCKYFDIFQAQLYKTPPNSEVLNKNKGALLWNALIFSAPQSLIKNLLNSGADLNQLNVKNVLEQKYVYPYFYILVSHLKEIPFKKLTRKKNYCKIT